MSKWVRLKNNIVAEVIPAYATPPEKWYGVTFASECIEAPDEVEQRWVHDPDAGTFSEPMPKPTPEMTTAEAELDLLTDINYRLSLVELGLTAEGDKA